MIHYSLKELDKVAKAIEEQGFSKIALANARGLVSTWNRSSISAVDHFQNKLRKYLESSSTSGGTYKILGRHAGSKAHNSFEVATIVKDGPEIAEQLNPIPMTVSAAIRETPNMKLVEEKSRFEFENKYLQQENERLLALIKDLEEANEELEEEILELEDKLEELTKTNQVLSESPVQAAGKQLAEMLPQLAMAVVPTLMEKFGLIPTQPAQQQPAQPLAQPVYGPPANTENQFNQSWLQNAEIVTIPENHAN